MAERGDTFRLRWLLALNWTLLLLLVVLWVPWRSLWWRGRGVPAEPRTVAPRGELADFEKTTAALFQAASPSVVYINTRARVANRWTRRVYEVESGTGSGFIWDREGHVVTNQHVIEGASSAQVVFQDQSSYEATLVGTSRETDLAVLEVDAPPELLQPVLIGESKDLVVGQAVFAIGNPFGLHHTLTTGIVSARSREIEGPSRVVIEDVIQTDAAINPGNSGGPLLDSAGRLIGVNTAIYSPSGASAGVGFAVPVDTVNRVIPQIIARGRYRPPQLGIRTSEEASELVRTRYGIEGVVVMAVEPGGGAAEAGLRGTTTAPDGALILGDVIQEVDGREVETVDDLLEELARHEPGSTVQLGIYRNGSRRTVSANVE